MNSRIVHEAHEQILRELDQIALSLNRTINGGRFGNESWQAVNYFNQRYFEDLEALEQKIASGRKRGMWRINTYYMADTSLTAQKVRNLLLSLYSGEESRPEKVRAIEIPQIADIASNFNLLSHELTDSQSQNHPIGMWTVQGRNIRCFIYRYQTIMSSDDVATFCQMPRKEMPGYYINPYVEFEVSERRSQEKIETKLALGSVVSGQDLTKNQYILDVNDLISTRFNCRYYRWRKIKYI